MFPLDTCFNYSISHFNPLSVLSSSPSSHPRRLVSLAILPPHTALHHPAHHPILFNPPPPSFIPSSLLPLPLVISQGDATLVLPAQKLYIETVKRVKRISMLIAERLQISGPFNIQFLSRDNEIKVIECNLRHEWVRMRGSDSLHKPYQLAIISNYCTLSPPHSRNLTWVAHYQYNFIVFVSIRTFFYCHICNEFVVFPFDIAEPPAPFRSSRKPLASTLSSWPPRSCWAYRCARSTSTCLTLSTSTSSRPCLALRDCKVRFDECTLTLPL
jgi:hypothetical protein